MKLRKATPLFLLAWAVFFGIWHYRQPGLQPRWIYALKLLPNPLALSSFVIPGYLKLLAGWAWLTGAGLGLGLILLSRFRLTMTALERALAALALGWGSLSMAMAALGLAGFWHAGLVYGGLAAATAAGACHAWKDRARLSAPAKGPSKHGNFVDRALLAMLVAGAALSFFCALMPDIFYDAHVYHLALPELYWARGAIVATPYNAYSGMPMAVEMLYALALPLGGDRLTHLMHWTFAVGSAAAAYCLARRLGSARAGLLGAVIFLSTPLVSILSWKAAVELAWTFFEVLSVLALLGGFSAQEDERRRWWAFSAICAGLAAASKFPAWPFVGVMALVIAGRGRKNPATSARDTARFLLIAGAVAAVWPLRNLWFYGNPLFPFGSAACDWRGLLEDGHKRNLALTFGSWAGLKALLLHPWSLLGARHSDFDDLGPLLIMGLPLLALAGRRGPARRALLGIAGLLWLAWCLTSEMVRFFIPILPLVAVLYSLVLESAPKAARAAAYLLLLAAFCNNTLLATDWFDTYDGKEVVLGLEAEQPYRERAHAGYPRPYEAGARFIRETLPATARVLVLGDARGFGIRRDFAAASLFDENPLKGYLRRSATAEELRDLLLRDRFTHILFNAAELRARGAQRWIKVDEREGAVYEQFLARYMRAVFERQDPPGKDYKTWAWTVVYEIARPTP